MAIPPISQNWIQYKGVTVERFHSQPSKLIEQIKIFTREKSLTPTGLVWGIGHRQQHGRWSSFGDTNMAVLASCENTLFIEQNVFFALLWISCKAKVQLYRFSLGYSLYWIINLWCFCCLISLVFLAISSGVDFQIKTMSIENRCIALQLWDTAGQERWAPF